MLEELFKKAKANGITKQELGQRVFKTPNNIYLIYNPRLEVFEKLQKALEELIEEKNIKKVKKDVDSA